MYTFIYHDGSSYSMSKLANFLLNISKTWAKTRGREPAITIGNNKFNYKFVKTKSNSKYSWENFYEFGNFFFEDYSNPIKIEYPSTESEKDYDLIPSKKYKQFMKMEIINRAFSTKSSKYDLLTKLMIASIALNILFGTTILAILGQ